MSTPADKPALDAGREHSVAARVEQLYEHHAALVRSVCRSLLRDRTEAEDAMQQTFLSAQRALQNGSSPRDAAAWLATIARHESLARVRARMREPLPVETDEGVAGPDAHAAAVRRQEAGELRDALAQLPAQQREAILLREVRGLSYQEVAASLSVTTSAVESLLFRARRSLQTRLEGALAALSPAGLMQPLRELAARLAGGGLVAPAAAKVAALGVGTAVLAGGAIDGPRVLGLGHAPAPVVKAAPAHRASLPSAAASATASGMLWPGPAAHAAHELADAHPRRSRRVGGGDSHTQQEVSDVHSISAPREGEQSGQTTHAAGGDRSTGSSSTHETGDGGQRAATGSTGDSLTSEGKGDGAAGSWSGSSLSGSDATTSSTTGSSSGATTTDAAGSGSGSSGD